MAESGPAQATRLRTWNAGEHPGERWRRQAPGSQVAMWSPAGPALPILFPYICNSRKVRLPSAGDSRALSKRLAQAFVRIRSEGDNGGVVMGGQEADPVGPCLGGFVGSWTLAKQTNALGPGQSGRHMWGRVSWDLGPAGPGEPLSRSQQLASHAATLRVAGAEPSPRTGPSGQEPMKKPTGYA